MMMMMMMMVCPSKGIGGVGGGEGRGAGSRKSQTLQEFSKECHFLWRVYQRVTFSVQNRILRI